MVDFGHVEEGNVVRVRYIYGARGGSESDGIDQERSGEVIATRPGGSGFTFDHGGDEDKLTSVLFYEEKQVRVYAAKRSPDWAPRRWHHLKDLNHGNSMPDQVDVEVAEA